MSIIRKNEVRVLIIAPNGVRLQDLGVSVGKDDCPKDVARMVRLTLEGEFTVKDDIEKKFLELKERQRQKLRAKNEKVKEDV